MAEPINRKPSVDLDWTSWHPLTEEIQTHLPSKPGVYRIRLGKPVGRLIETDEHGILYIGKHESSLASRVKDFLVSTRGNHRHAAGDRFDLLDLQAELNLELSDLEVSAAIVPQDHASRVERELQFHYQLEYGELPPLNNSGGVSPTYPPAEQ